MPSISNLCLYVLNNRLSGLARYLQAVFIVSKCFGRLESNLHSIICQEVAYGSLKTKEKLKLLALRVVAVTVERWS